MVWGRDILPELVLKLKFSNHFIDGYGRPFKGSKSPMVDLGMYEFIYFETGKITPEELFMNAYSDEVYKLDQVRTSNKWLLVTLDARYQNAYFNKVMENQCQHLIETQYNEFLKLLQTFEEFLDVTLGTWKHIHYTSS